MVQVGDVGFGFFRLGDDPAVPGDWAPRCPFARGVSALAAESGVPAVFIDGNRDNLVLLARLAERRGATGPSGLVPVEDHKFWAPRGHRWERVRARSSAAVTRVDGLASILQHDDRALLGLDLAVTPPP